MKNPSVSGKILYFAGVPFIELEGEINVSSDVEIGNLVKSITDTGNYNIIFNMGKVSYINSAGLAILIGIAMDLKEHGGLLKFVNLSKHLEKIINIIGLTEHVKIYPDVESAIK